MKNLILIFALLAFAVPFPNARAYEIAGPDAGIYKEVKQGQRRLFGEEIAVAQGPKEIFISVLKEKGKAVFCRYMMDILKKDIYMCMPVYMEKAQGGLSDREWGRNFYLKASKQQFLSFEMAYWDTDCIRGEQGEDCAYVPLSSYEKLEEEPGASAAKPARK